MFWISSIIALLLLLLSCPSIAQNSGADPTADYTCSLAKPCKLGCCGISGYCGFGPNYCGDGNCLDDCDRKSECDPGWGPEWSNATSCPLKVCCSPYGFCGTTKEFCGNKTVTQPSCSSDGASARGRVVGYYEAWNIQRCCDQRFPQDIYMGAWTHLNFAFVYIDPNTFEIVPMDPLDVQLYQNFTDLKKTYPALQTWISVGGWAMNDPGQYSTTFSDLAASSTAMEQFSNSLIGFMEKYNFDGVDIDWEYPVAEERSGRPEDLENFVTWLTQLKSALDGKYGLTITIPSSYWYMRHFDISRLIDLVDWFNVMTYDLHGTWDGTNPYVGKYVNSHANATEIDQALDLLWRNDIPADKVAMGLGFYGRGFTLEDPSCAKAGCKWVDGSTPGSCTKNRGTLSYAEINEVLMQQNPLVTYDTKAMVNEVVWDQDQWISLDEVRAFTDKYAYANSRCLGGLLIWAITLDTPEGQAHRDLCMALECTTYREAYVERPCGCGTTSKCRRWHTVYQGDSCYAIHTNAGLTYDQFRALNPEINANCTNLKLGYQYCTEGEPASPNLSTCQPGDNYYNYYGSTTYISSSTTPSTSSSGSVSTGKTYSISTPSDSTTDSSTSTSTTSSTTSSTSSVSVSTGKTYSISTPSDSTTDSSTSTSTSSSFSVPTGKTYSISTPSDSTSDTTTSPSTLSSTTSSTSSSVSVSTDKTYDISTPSDSTTDISSSSSTEVTTSRRNYDTTSYETTSDSTVTSTFILTTYDLTTESSESTTSTSEETSSTCSSTKLTTWISVDCPPTRYREL